MRNPLLVLLGTLLFGPLARAGALPPDTMDARAIMEAVEGRDTGDRMDAHLRITITDKAGRERVREVQTRALEVGEGRKTTVIFEAPADVRNTGLLSIEYDDARSDDQWLYLPSLGRTTRIAASDKSGSFMGTDLSYADLTARDPDHYDYVLLDPAAEVDGVPAWVIEATPRTDAERQETGYLKTVVWVGKETLLPLQVKAWVIDGKKIKYTRRLQVENIDGVWFARRLVVRAVRGAQVESTSVLDFTRIEFGDEEVDESEFTVARLERGL